MARLAPSILSADFAALGDAVDSVTAEADLLHVDVMDGHFVPNLTIGPPVVASLRRHTDLYFDCHLMITNPENYLEQFRAAGANGCTVHVELGRTGPLIDQMRSLGLDVGLAVSPDTPFEVFSEWLDRIDLLLLMTVHPGFGGQSFIADVLPKVRRTRQEIDGRGLAIPIEVDGGIDLVTAPMAATAGASIFVAGSAIFGEPDPAAAALAIRRAVHETSWDPADRAWSEGGPDHDRTRGGGPPTVAPQEGRGA